MYSYADRLRAVELYIRFGKRLKATIRQLGYPTKNALRGWYREHEQNLDLRVQPVARAPNYSEAEKQAATTFVVIDEVALEDWGVGGLPVADYRKTLLKPS